MKAHLAAILALAGTQLALPAQRAAAQTGDPLPAVTVGARTVPVLGDWEDDERRLGELLAGQSSTNLLLRSTSTLLKTEGAATSRPRFELFLPRGDVAWNSDIPFSLNDGALRAERGLNLRVLFGLSASAGPLSVVIAPEYLYEENRDFIPLTERSADLMVEARRDTLSTPWYAFDRGADLPLRFGYEPRRTLGPGQSSATLTLGPVALGAATENRWWGPGVRNALVMSSNASGVPHVFVRTARPIRTAIGDFEALWMEGQLRESAYFDTTAVNDRRALSSLAVTYRPRAVRNLSFGLARSVYAALPDSASRGDEAGNVFTRWDMRGGVDTAAVESREQVLSLFARWAFPNDGLEVYGEWARARLPSDLRDFLEYPGFSQGYTLGLQGVRRNVLGGSVRLQTEISYLEQNPRGRPSGSYYTSPHVIQGYTHEGETIGAAIGPGASNQWVAGDFLASSWRLGLFAERIRWDNDAYYTKPSGPRYYYGHDVSMIAGIRGGVTLPYARIQAELMRETRYNYHYQNWGYVWDDSDDAIDIDNRVFRLTVVPAGLFGR